MHRRQPRLGDLELQIMNVLWAGGPASVRQVLEALPGKPKPAYTTVLTMLRLMHEKGYVDRREQGRAHVYQARLREEPVKRGLVRNLVDRAFAGSAEALLVRLVDDGQVTAEELARIQRIIAAREKGVGDGKLA